MGKIRLKEEYLPYSSHKKTEAFTSVYLILQLSQ